MKKYILIALFFLNFAFVFQHGKLEVTAGLEVKGQELGLEYDTSGWTTDTWEAFANTMGIPFSEITPEEYIDKLIEEKELTGNNGFTNQWTEGLYFSVFGLDVTVVAQDLDLDGKLDHKCIYDNNHNLIFDGDINYGSTDPITQTDEFLAWLEGNYGTEVPEVITDGMLFDYYNEDIFSNPPIVNDEGVPDSDSEGYFKPKETDGFPASTKTEADRIKNIMGSTTDIVQKINILKGEASNNGANKYEYGIAINKNSTGFYLYNSPTNGILQTDELVGTVGVDFNQETQVFVHNHTDPSLKTLSSTDVNSLLYQYKWIRDHGGDLKAKIQIGPDQSQSMVYVDDKTKLNAFIQKYGDNLIKAGEKVFNTDKKIGKDFEKVQIELKKQGYSPSVAYRYTLTYVLDKYQSGLKMFFKESGATDFKQQGIEIKPYTTPNGKTITLYKPLISK